MSSELVVLRSASLKQGPFLWSSLDTNSTFRSCFSSPIWNSFFVFPYSTHQQQSSCYSDDQLWHRRSAWQSPRQWAPGTTVAEALIRQWSPTSVLTEYSPLCFKALEDVYMVLKMICHCPFLSLLFCLFCLFTVQSSGKFFTKLWVLEKEANPETEPWASLNSFLTPTA